MGQEKQQSSWQGKRPNIHKKSYFTFREGNHKAVLALIPGTPEQMQAEMAALKETIRNIQMGLGGAKIHVPECPV